MEAKPQVKKAQPRVPVSSSSRRSQLRINYIIPRWRLLLGYSNPSLSPSYCGISPGPALVSAGQRRRLGEQQGLARNRAPPQAAPELQ